MSALGALLDARRGGHAVASWTLLGLCVAVSVPSFFSPELRDLLGGIGPDRRIWQLFTAVLVHGWPGFPGWIHLGLDAFLILECGRPCERLLGTGRFLLLSLAAAAANAVAQRLAGGVNGSSLVIWAWGPPLAWALIVARRAGGSAREPARERIRAVLLVMYLAVTLAMGLLPYAFGWRGNPLVALLRANTFHLVATGVGLAATLAWRSRIARRIDTLANRERIPA